MPHAIFRPLLFEPSTTGATPPSPHGRADACDADFRYVVPYLTDTHLVSAAVAHCVEYQPGNHDGNQPKWGFDIFDSHVLAGFERFVEAHPGRGGRRALFTLPPIVTVHDFTRTNPPHTPRCFVPTE